MAVVRAIFQPMAAGHQHAGELNGLLAEPWITSVILSSAFANSNGVAEVAPALRQLGNRCKLYIGARNGSTTAQAIARLLATGAEVYLVDTAMRARIFHPKLFLARGNGVARVVMGSANLTHAGLFNNIEAGANMELDLGDVADARFVNSFVAGFDKLEADFPDHCFAIQSGRQIVTLMREGVLEDERKPTATTALGAGRQGPNTNKPRIGLPFRVPPIRVRTRRPRPPAPAPGTVMSVMPQYGALLWAKPNLPTSDLQQLVHGNNPGVLRLTQARFEVNGQRINQATYFRNDVFGSLAWAVDPNDPGKEMADIEISLVIAGVYVGDFDLHLSHKPAWAAGQAQLHHWDALGRRGRPHPKARPHRTHIAPIRPVIPGRPIHSGNRLGGYVGALPPTPQPLPSSVDDAAVFRGEAKRP